MASISVGFEGSCPHSSEGVREEGAGRFRILPSWRPSPGVSEEAVGRSTRLGFKIVNDTPETEIVEIVVDWQYDDAPPTDRPEFPSRESYMSHRDFVVVREPGAGAEWCTVMGDVTASEAAYRIAVKPGETEVHWHPPYTYTQSERFVELVREHPWVAVDSIGASQEGRNLWLVTIDDGSTREKTPAFIRARCHAYESGGSYAMEGMVKWLLSDEPWASAAVREYAFHIIPMCNPDGVVNGMGRLTAPKGANTVWAKLETPDSAHQAVVDTVLRVRPKLFIDLHNWQNKHADGLLGIGPDLRERFLTFMPDQLDHGKQWYVAEAAPPPAAEPEREIMGAFCRRTFGAEAVSFEFPWFGRTPEMMRDVGRQALWAMLRALDGPYDITR